jgi:hypothetical protein
MNPITRRRQRGKAVPGDHRRKARPYFNVRELIARLIGGRWPPELHGRTWQGVRSTLLVLAERVHEESGRWTGTVWQLAQGVQLSEEWVRRCLQVLEALDIVTWLRGGIAAGRVTPSHFQISKARLAELERMGRPAKDAAERLHNAETRARIRRILLGYHKAPKPPSSAFAQVIPSQLSRGLPPVGGGIHNVRIPSRPTEGMLTLEEALQLTVTDLQHAAPAAPSPDQRVRASPNSAHVTADEAYAGDEPPAGMSWREVVLAQISALSATNRRRL